MKKINNEELINRLIKKTHEIMEDAKIRIHRNEKREGESLYDGSTHTFLQKENVMMGVSFLRDIYLPLPKVEWPEAFINLDRNYASEMKWPNYSTYCYIMDVLHPPFIPSSLLYFGYAAYRDLLIKCPFFVVFQMTEQKCGEGRELLPEACVIDPLAVRDGKNPECYIGIPVKKNYLEEWLLSRGKTGTPLEAYVNKNLEKKERERNYFAYMEAYHMQMHHEPQWFPSALIEFAKKEGLYIPEGQKSRN